MLWTLDVGGFRQRSNQFNSVEDAQEAVLHAASNVDAVSKIQEMAVVNPKERASAAQMLVKYYNGVGLSNPRNQVPALINSPVATTVTRTPAPPALATRISRAFLMFNLKMQPVRFGKVNIMKQAGKAIALYCPSTQSTPAQR
jgi:hypothetical protein